MTPTIDRKLNLVIPVENGDQTSYVHSTPISRQVFEANFEAIGRTFSRIYGGGYGLMAGPRIAAMMLRKVAEDFGGDDPTARAASLALVESSLMNEVRRLSNWVAVGPSGWASIPYQEAVDKKLISEDDAAEVENALVFFTVASSMHKKSELPIILAGASKIWGARIELSNSTAFAASLRTSTEAASSGATGTTLSVPS